MKKWLVGFVVIILAAGIATYALIPGVIKFSKIEKVGANSEEAYRYFADSNLREKWVHKVADSTGKVLNISNNFFIYQKDSFIISGIHNPTINVTIGAGNERFQSQMLMVPESVDSTIIIWDSEIKAGANPISRISYYLMAKKLKSRFEDILSTYKTFVSVPENVYSFPIVKEKVKDTILMTIRKIYPKNPDISDIYQLIKQLEKYVLETDAKITNAPMLNITVLDSTHYQCTVALPVNKEIKNISNIYLSKMVPGKILVETVKGGPATIKYAFSKLSDYFRQHKHVSPALSFESLITNRSTETDTTKWITKIYYPIF